MNEFTIWNNFFLASAGGSAALTGLVFVGVSISLARILEIPKVSSRAVDALAFLLLIFIISLICLIPNQSVHMIGFEILILILAAELLIFRSDLDLLKSSPKEYKAHQKLNLFLNQVVMVPYLISTVLLSFGFSHGIYWLAPAFILSFIKSLVDAWVLLIEIHR